MLSILGFVSIAVGLLAALVLFLLLFGKVSAFKECLQLALKANVLVIKGDWSGVWSSAKLVIWVVGSYFFGALAYAELPGWLPGIFH